eukprot:Phypoly_transcript_00947.p1 GENE.Phypoly_transcript_00947~~Phypoly_transcript_00947.p1  ORF type:complete len:1258 (+),score=163.50 Phypoly_transcript_00947:35-3808(+)
MSPSNALSLSSVRPPGSAYSSLCWNDTILHTQVIKTLNQDWTPYKALYFSMYNSGQGGSMLYLILESDTNGGDYDYYDYPISLSWTGWKSFVIPFSSFVVTRNPAGWNIIQRMYFAASGWSMVNSPLTQVCFNGFELGGLSTYANFLTVDFTYALVPGYVHQSIPIILTNPSRVAQSYVVSTASGSVPSGFSYLFSLTPTGTASTSLTVTYTSSSPENITIYATLKTTKSVGSTAQPLVQLTAPSDPTHKIISSFNTLLQVVAPTPLSGGLTRPFLFLDNGMKAAMTGTGLKEPYAVSELSTATSRLSANLSVPQQWGAWSGYFFCNDGTGLTFNASNNTTFYCSSEKRYYTGEPYNKAWYTVKHNQVISYLQDLAIGYYLSGNTTFSTAAINILVQYSVFYPALPFRDINEKSTTSGGRLLSQTLDESNVMPMIANAFDLVYSRMTTTQQAIVEYNLIRAMAATIKRYNAGAGNWQTWHNAAMAIAGYAVNDHTLVEYAVNGTSSGFYYQLQNSVSDDGFWWENSIAYHFYALSAMQWLLAVSGRRGNNLCNARVTRNDHKGTKTIESMYIAPIQILEPLRVGWGTPSLNDDHSSDGYISSEASIYVFANYQWGPSGLTPSANKQAYSWVLSQSKLPALSMLFWGAPVSPGSFSPGSVDLPVTGLTILSASATKDWMLLKHGPHGGYHGHYDKLELLFDHSLNTLLEDYGTVEYTQPLHYNYFKRSLAHNTLLVDGVSQFEASGNSLFFGTSLPDFLVMSANSTQLNTGVPVAAQRTVVLFPNLDGTGRTIAIDLLEPIKLNSSAPSHDYFSVYHSSGDFQMKQGPTLASYTIPYVSKEPAWGYFTNAKSGSVSANSAVRYAWNNPGLSVQDGYESTNNWNPSSVFVSSVSLSTKYVKEGTCSFEWKNQVAGAQFSKTNVITDWSSASHVSWWMYNVVSNNALITLVLYSENATSSGIDYFSYRITLNWTGWKLFNISRSAFPASRFPVGWNKIDSVTWSSSWSATPNPTSHVFIDAFHVYRADGSLVPDTAGWGLEVLSDSNSVARQLITATAPNQPATSYHPVAVTKITGESLFAHLLITPPSPSTVSVTFSSYLSQSTYARYSFSYGSTYARVYLMRGGSAQKSSVKAGVRVELVRAGVTTTSAYRVPFISPVSITDTSIGLSGTQVTGKISAWNLSPLTCNMTVSVYETFANAICHFNTTASSFTYSGALNGVAIPSTSLVKTSTKVGSVNMISISYLLPVGSRTVSFKITV